MARVIITKALFLSIKKKFSRVEAKQILDSFETAGKNPHKGKAFGNVAGIVIKELKRQKHRFYFITDGHVLKAGTEDELANLLIKFVSMSEKKDQQKIVEGIKSVLKSIGFEGF